jgi:SAM-dependent methyltransferase
MKATDVVLHNRSAWDGYADQEIEWSRPVGGEVIARARAGEFSILLTGTKLVPREWFPASLEGVRVLCLASGGGQQAPVLAAAGARVTSFDNSPGQLGKDRLVAEREGLDIVTVVGDMRDLSVFADESFDLVFHPVSNIFCPEVRPVWREVARVLATGGTLLAGMMNPAAFMFDPDEEDQGRLVPTFAIPYEDARDLPAERLERWRAEGRALEYSHTLEDLLGGQTDAGLAIVGFYEDRDPRRALDRLMAVYLATRSVKLP